MSETYAGAQRYFDADSHIMETPDWIAAFADDRTKKLLKPLGLLSAGSAAFHAIEKAMARAEDREATKKLEEDVIGGPKGWFALGAFDARERTRALDRLGFEKQLVFSTFAMTQFMRTKNLGLVYGGTDAHNRAITAFCEADARLIPVGIVPLRDPAKARTALDRALEMGCGAICVGHMPAGDEDMSPGHPDFDPFWGRLEEAGIPFVNHIGFSQRDTVPKAYENNGHPRPTDFLGGGENVRYRDVIALSFPVQMFLTALIYDGVFRRFPDLKGGVIELGASWVPDFMARLDTHMRGFAKTEPLLQELDLLPSEYLKRQMKFTPFPGDDIGHLMAISDPGLYLFSSDYPHPEGTKDPIGRFLTSLDAAGIPDEDRQRFYWRNFAEMTGDMPAPEAAAA